MNVAQVLRLGELSQVVATKNAVAILAALNSPTIRVENRERRTVSDLMGLLGPTDAVAALQALRRAATTNALFESAFVAMSTTGVDLSTEVSQAVLDMLAQSGEVSTAIVDRIKSVGLRFVSIAEANGVESITVEDVDAALVELENDELRAQCAARYNLVIAAIDAGTVNTFAEAAALFAGA